MRLEREVSKLLEEFEKLLEVAAHVASPVNAVSRLVEDVT